MSNQPNAVATPAQIKERIFISVYLEDPKRDGQKAAVAAGYALSGAKVRANEILNRPHVKAEIARRLEMRDKRSAKTLDDVIAELEKIAFANTIDFSRLTPDGDMIPDFSNLTRDQAAAISEIETHTYMEGKGDDAREVKRVKVKLFDKKGALVDLGKHHGGFVTKTKNEHTGPDGLPIEVDNRIVVTYVDSKTKR